MGNYIFHKAKKSKTDSAVENKNIDVTTTTTTAAAAATTSTTTSDSSSSANSSSKQQQKKSKKQKILKMAAPIIIQPTVKQTASVIFLHGLGDTGHGWSYAFREIKKPHVKYIFPTAPVRSVTLNAGMSMTAWFDIIDLGPGSKQDEAGLKESSQALLKLVDDEIKNGIPSERIIIGGFSQGGATALYTASTSPLRFAGVLALSTWLPLHEKLASFLDKTPEKFKTPILQCHGDQDPLVPAQWAAMSSKFLESAGFEEVKFKVYKGLMHSSTDEEMDDVKDFVDKVVA